MNTRTDFENELAQIDKNLVELGAGAGAELTPVERATRSGYCLYRRASLTGNFSDFEVAEQAIDAGIEKVGPGPDLCFLKANLDFKFHRLPKVRNDLEMVPGLADSPSGRALWADLDLQEGRYEEARIGYENVIQENRSWDALARLAHLRGKLGDESIADELYLEAEDEITAKEMRSYAWVELQRGLLDMAHGRYADAWSHYNRAGKAYTGYWLVDEHIAELLGAEGKLDAAISLYQLVASRVTKPETKQTIGELYQLMGESEEAEAWYQEALQEYLDSAERGHVHYYHHLADFYSDVRQEGSGAVKWARKDFELRPNFATASALAWAYYRNDQITDALELIDQALSSGAKDAHLFYKAGRIYLAAGRTVKGEKLLERVAEINPRHGDFHVHH
jgi:tetratricopeptide (TPR) repeat protein